MGTIIAMLWKLLKTYIGKFLVILIKLVKAQLKAVLWKYGTMFFLLVLTFTLAYLVLR